MGKTKISVLTIVADGTYFNDTPNPHSPPKAERYHQTQQDLCSKIIPCLDKWQISREVEIAAIQYISYPSELALEKKSNRFNLKLMLNGKVGWLGSHHILHDAIIGILLRK